MAVIDLINQIPDWLGAAICAAFGWVAHVVYEVWQKRNSPFEQDIERFNKIVTALDPHAVEYFQNADVGHFSALYSDQLLEASGNIDLINKFEKLCMDTELNCKERDLVKALNKITNFIAWKSYYRSGSTTSRTFLWDAFRNENYEDRQAKIELQDNLNELGKSLFDAYQSYKAYGDRKFAKRVTK